MCGEQERRQIRLVAGERELPANGRPAVRCGVVAPGGERPGRDRERPRAGEEPAPVERLAHTADAIGVACF